MDYPGESNIINHMGPQKQELPSYSERDTGLQERGKERDNEVGWL